MYVLLVHLAKYRLFAKPRAGRAAFPLELSLCWL
jgi:hypothetical protein